LKEIRIIVPDNLYEKLVKAERRYKIRKEDLVLRALIKVLDTYLGEDAYK